MELHHLVLSTAGREPLFLERGPRRAALRALVRVAGDRLWLFGFADDHLHAVVADPWPTRLGGHVALAFASLPGAPPMQPSWAEPVDGREHLKRLVPYVLRQSEHHGLGPSATWEGTCFHDLVGARRIAGFDGAAWRKGLPREDERLAWSAVGLDQPAGVHLAGKALEPVVEVAARAMCADPALEGQATEVLRARHLAVALGLEAGFRIEQIAPALHCSTRQARRYIGVVDEADLRAVRRALAIDQAVARRAARAA